MVTFWISLYLILTAILALQGAFTIAWMLYAWNNPIKIKKFNSPSKFSRPNYSYSALIPARHEVKVIKDTIKAVSAIDYPEHLKEILVICRHDDEETINEVIKSLKQEIKSDIRLIVFNGKPINKPHGLNHALKEARNNIITIFDAEDEPHRDIYKVVNTIFTQEKVDVVQSGVQLMNYRSNWFSTLNCMEYFFWFKSGLQFFSNVGGVTPLGGNTVFFKKNQLEEIGGWDQNCLTEDADVGFRLVLNGAKIRVVYDHNHVTKEETPHTVDQFIKQRTRWFQGFLQIFFKGDWLKLNGFKRKVFAGYILLSSLFLSSLFIYIPLGIYLIFTVEIPLLVSLITYIPMQIMFLQILITAVGLYEFTKAYKLKYYPWLPFKVLITFYPYIALLSISTFRAVYRLIIQNSGWEKTMHTNAHREIDSVTA